MLNRSSGSPLNLESLSPMAGKTTSAGLQDCLVVVLGPLAIYAFMAALVGSLVDGDTGWHLAAGRWIIAHAGVPRSDPFSYSFANAPWTAHEWLSEVLMYATWRAGGWGGLLLLFASAAATTFAILAVHVRRWLTPAATALMLVYTAIALTPFLLARPHMLALPILTGWLVILLRSREAGRVPPLPAALLMLLWANLHGGFVLGLGLAGAFGLEALIEAPHGKRRDVVMRWGLFGLTALIASLFTPSGVEGLVFPFRVASLKLLSGIAEWMPSDFATLQEFEICLLTALFFCLFKPVRVPAIRLLVLLLLLHMALQHMRQQAILVVVAALLLAEPLARAYAPQRDMPRQSLRLVLRNARGEFVPFFLVTLALFAGLGAWRLLNPMDRSDSRGVPVTALRHLPPQLRDRRVFNEYSFGGLLILQGIKVFIDGRADMYGDPFTLDYIKMTNDGDIDRWRTADRKWRFDWVILPPGSKLLAAIAREPGWRRIYADKWAVILERAAAPALVRPIRGGDR